MSRKASGYSRQARELYTTPDWTVLRGLANHVRLQGMTIAEPACGNGRLVAALIQAGAKRVYASDLNPEGYAATADLFGAVKLPKPVTADFLEGAELPRTVDMIVTNPPYGSKGLTAMAFIQRGLEFVVSQRIAMCLLLPVDFDSAKSRKYVFGGSPYFAGRISLTERVNWFAGMNKNTENHAWFVWQWHAMAWPPRAFAEYAP